MSTFLSLCVCGCVCPFQTTLDPTCASATSLSAVVNCMGLSAGWPRLAYSQICSSSRKATPADGQHWLLEVLLPLLLYAACHVDQLRSAPARPWCWHRLSCWLHQTQDLHPSCWASTHLPQHVLWQARASEEAHRLCAPHCPIPILVCEPEPRLSHLITASKNDFLQALRADGDHSSCTHTVDRWRMI